MNTLQIVNELTTKSRATASDLAWRLGEKVFEAEKGVDSPLVEGEQGVAHVGTALGRLITGRSRKEVGTPRAPVSPLEAWLQAEVVAAGVAAVHELETGEPVTPEAQLELRYAVTDFALRQVNEAAPAPQIAA